MGRKQAAVISSKHMLEGEAKSVNLSIMPISLNSQMEAARHLTRWESGWNKSVCINNCLCLLIHFGLQKRIRFSLMEIQIIASLYRKLKFCFHLHDNIAIT